LVITIVAEIAVVNCSDSSFQCWESLIALGKCAIGRLLLLRLLALARAVQGVDSIYHKLFKAFSAQSLNRSPLIESSKPRQAHQIPGL
jgi:hypothetical protein